MLHVLFLCTGNSCRSIIAEALLNQHGKGRIKVSSAGSFPTGYVHPKSLETLASKRISAVGYHSKSWDMFAGQAIDIVITVCDAAAGESCPLFPGNPLKAHWGVSDPAHYQGTEFEINAEFIRVCNILEQRIIQFLELPFETMEKSLLQRELQRIAADS